MSKDTIYRQAAIKAIGEDGTWLERQGCTVITMVERKQRDADILSDLPPAEPERKKGKWIFHETENDRYDDMICPFCKNCYTVDAYRIDDIGFTAEDFNFCPNCGADMRGDTDETD